MLYVILSIVLAQPAPETPSLRAIVRSGPDATRVVTIPLADLESLTLAPGPNYPEVGHAKPAKPRLWLVKVHQTQWIVADSAPPGLMVNANYALGDDSDPETALIAAPMLMPLTRPTPIDDARRNLARLFFGRPIPDADQPGDIWPGQPLRWEKILVLDDGTRRHCVIGYREHGVTRALTKSLQESDADAMLERLERGERPAEVVPEGLRRDVGFEWDSGTSE